jgi:hypothetical protein
MRARVPAEKQSVIVGEIDKCMSRRSVTKREALALIGRLNYVARVVKAGRPYLSKLIAAANTAKSLVHFIHLSKETKKDLRWWREFLAEFGGSVPLPRSPLCVSGDTMNLSTDASDRGYGAVFGSEWFSAPLPDEHRSWSINIREVYAVLLAICTWRVHMASCIIFLCCDNEAAVKVLDKGRSKQETIDALVRDTYKACATDSIDLVACHTPGVENGPADALSRADLERFHELTPSANPVMTGITWPHFLGLELSDCHIPAPTSH